MVEVSFRTFFTYTLIINFIFAIPILSLLTASGLINFQNALFFFFPFSIIEIPISTILSWLMAKGSNWTNTASAMGANGAVAGQLYCVFLGGLAGYKMFGMIGATIMVVILFIIGSFTGFFLGKYLMQRMVVVAGVK